MRFAIATGDCKHRLAKATNLQTAKKMARILSIEHYRTVVVDETPKIRATFDNGREVEATA